MTRTVSAMRLYDVVLWIHITAVIAFGALFAYPVFLAVNARAPIAERASLHRSQIAFSRGVTGPAIGIVLRRDGGGGPRAGLRRGAEDPAAVDEHHARADRLGDLLHAAKPFG